MNKKVGFQCDLIGQHNADNALMACLAARQVGVSLEESAKALTTFDPPKRRLELLASHKGISIFDDFAHHPTAIETTLKSLRSKHRQGKILAVFEPRSATMKKGVHQATLAKALSFADFCFLYQVKNLSWDLNGVMKKEQVSYEIFQDVSEIVNAVMNVAQPNDTIVIMSNGGFEGIHTKMVEELRKK